jgi:hypothetical protein
VPSSELLAPLLSVGSEGGEEKGASADLVVVGSQESGGE